MATILLPLPRADFDPTEAGVPWRVLSEAGHAFVFATPDAGYLSARWPGDAHRFAHELASMLA